MSVRNIMMESQMLQTKRGPAEGPLRSVSEDSEEEVMNLDDEESLFNSSGDTASRKDLQAHIDDAFVRHERQVIAALRCLIVVVLAFTGTLTAASLYLAVGQADDEMTVSIPSYNNDSSYVTTTQADHILRHLQSKFADMLDEVKGMSRELEARGGQDWPFATLKHMDELGAASRRASPAIESILLLPMVEKRQLPAWANYTIQERDWLAKSLAGDHQVGVMDPVIHDLSGNGSSGGNGPFLPLWQLSPASPDATVYNTDMMSLPGLAQHLEAVLQNGDVVLGDLIDASSTRNELTSFLERIMVGISAEPVATLFRPIVSDNRTLSKRVGVIGVTFHWRSLLADYTTLLDSDPPVVCVIGQASSGVTLSYLVSSREVVFLGVGDKHSAQFHGVEAASTWNALNKTSSAQSSSVFTSRVFPSISSSSSKTLRHGATFYAVVVAVMFALMTVLFLLYDCIVQRRQKEVYATALRSSKIVSSLFPTQVADRLFHDVSSDVAEQDVIEDIDVREAFLDNSNVNDRPGHVKKPQKHKLKLKQVLKDNAHAYDDLTSHNDKPVSALRVCDDLNGTKG
jgi:hypothetical protein